MWARRCCCAEGLSVLLLSLHHVRRPVFSWIALGLLVIVLAPIARADVLDIPRDERFPKAQYPFARVIDGCRGWRQPDRFGQGFGAVDFNAACVAHDQCFHTVGMTWGECNRNYLTALHEACLRDLKRQRLELGSAQDPDPQALMLCYDVADLFMTRVQDAAAVRRYEVAQKQQRAYLAHVRAAIHAVYVDALKRPATADEEQAAIKQLDQEVGLRTLRRALQTDSDQRSSLLSREKPRDLPQINEASLVGLLPAESLSANQDKGR